jgi:hypothetical protein
MKKISILLISLSVLIFASCGDGKKDVKQSDTMFHETPITPTDSAELKSESTETEKKAGEFILNDLLTIESEAALKEKYGAENITQSEEWFAEGTVKLTLSVLYPETEKEVKFTWQDEATLSGISNIAIERKGSVWKTNKGITIGTKLSELEKLNGQAFTFYGFGWDYGGATSFKNGKLESEKMIITFGTLSDKYDEDAYMKLLGDAEFKSDSPEAKAFNPEVIYLALEK